MVMKKEKHFDGDGRFHVRSHEESRTRSFPDRCPGYCFSFDCCFLLLSPLSNILSLSLYIYKVSTKIHFQSFPIMINIRSCIPFYNVGFPLVDFSFSSFGGIGVIVLPGILSGGK